MYLVKASELRVTRNPTRLAVADHQMVKFVFAHLGLPQIPGLRSSVSPDNFTMILQAVHEDSVHAKNLIAAAYCAWMPAGAAALIEVRYAVYAIQHGMVPRRPSEVTPWQDLCTDDQLKSFRFTE